MFHYFKGNQGTGSNSAITSLVTKLQDTINAGRPGNNFAGQFSMESFENPQLAADIGNQLEENFRQMEMLSNGSGFSLESYVGSGIVSTSRNGDWLAQHQMKVARQSAAIMMEAIQDPVAYHNSFKTSLEAFENSASATNVSYSADYTTGDRAAAQSIMTEDMLSSLEAFENNNLSAALTHSLAYQFLAPVQEPFIEALFKTVVMGPDQVAFFYEIQLDRFWNGVQHTGDPRNPKQWLSKRNVMDAIRKPSILSEDVLNLVPVYKEFDDKDTSAETTAAKAARDAIFMPSSLMTPKTRTVANYAVKTNPLKVGVEINLLTVTEAPHLLNGGVFDETDTIDANLALENLYLSITDTTNGNTTKIIQFPLRGLERRNWVKAIQGHGNDMDLKFKSTELVIDENTVSPDGTVPDKVKELIKAGYRLRLAVEVVGTANVESAYMSVSYASVKVDKVIKVDVDSSTGATIYSNGKPSGFRVITPAEKDDFDKAISMLGTLSIDYYDIYGNRTNRNIRTQGLLVDTDVFTAKIAVGVRSPIRLQRPVGSDKSYPTVEKLIHMTRVRQTADAFSELFSYIDTLRTYVSRSTSYDDTRIPDFFGLGKYLVRPYFDEIEVDIAEFIKSSETKNNLENAREGLVGILQEAAARCVVESRWNIAATYLNGGKEVRPHFVIATGNYIPLLLSVKGDLRLLGANFDHTVVTSMNEDMDNTILMTLVDPDNDGITPLGFGNTLHYPDLITTISPHALNGSLRETVMVSPRYQHVCNLPIMILVKVKGIEEFMRTYNVYRTKTVEATTTTASTTAQQTGGLATGGTVASSSSTGSSI